MEDDKVKVKVWSFCPKCKGGGCGTCNHSGKVFELVLLKSLPRGVKGEYETAQADFIREQLEDVDKGH